jgi:uncharacterized protein YaiL (DUF2058 family)
MEKKSSLAEQLHIWYLEAITSGFAGEQYNPDAIKEYKDLSEEQKNIDKYIAAKVKALFKAKMLEMIGGDKNFNSEVCMWRDDADMVKEVRGLCKGYNQAKAELRKKVEGV